MEIPGQYTNRFEPTPQQHIKIVEVQKEVECIEKGRNITKILSVKGSNGKTYQYQIFNKNSHNSKDQQNYLLPFLNNQLKQIMNIKLASNKECSSRNLLLKGLGEYFVS
mmetsp:Transcript_36716/g.32931  ORF Transcript_36716/g.32931 Transcript_36716/m.32931 type:complete len:109 (-) Transcript_36716:910-1236(-)